MLNLLPQPRSVVLGEGTARVREPVVRREPSLPAQGYELTIGDDGALIAAADDAGAFYGAATWRQLARTHPGGIPVCTIRDWPDLPVRAVMLDISRDKVPTLATLRDLVERLASWKVNHLQLYMEHTFAYAGHEEVWSAASPLTPGEVRALDHWCRAHHVELVANQNCLGHMGRWLRHGHYRPMAMSPDGFTDAWGRRRPPMTLDPAAPGALALVRDLLGQLLACFESERVHVGLDEPWEMPEARVPEYLDWVRALRDLPEIDQREVLMWGDVVAGHRDRIDALPERVTVCEWGYEDWWPFDERAAMLADAGRSFWVCPGTSSWLSILGRTTNMRGNCAAAARAAIDHGAGGQMVTDWGDQGHLQYLPVSEPGFAYAAALGWCLETNADLDLVAALDAHVFGDATRELGAALLALGDVHREITPQVPNVSALVLTLYFPQLRAGRGMLAGITGDELDTAQASISEALSRIERSRPERADGALVVDELRNGAMLVELLCRDLRARLAGDGSLTSVPASTRRGFAVELDSLIDAHRELWFARNRPGGLDDSVSWPAHLRRCYETGVVDPDWGSAYPG